MKVIEVEWNYSPAVMESNGNRIEAYGETWSAAKVGAKGVTEIQEHVAQFEGDKTYYDVLMEDGMIRVFNPNVVYFEATV